MSWADEERDVTAWLGNELQNEAFRKLYAQKAKVEALRNPDFDYVWRFMQTSDHFYYMATKWLSGRGCALLFQSLRLILRCVYQLHERIVGF